jgi:hypothetical protein
MFDQKSFERNQLLEAQGCLLYLALAQMTHLDYPSAERSILGGLNEQVAAQAGPDYDELLQLASMTETQKSTSVLQASVSKDGPASSQGHAKLLAENSITSNDSG